MNMMMTLLPTRLGLCTLFLSTTMVLVLLIITGAVSKLVPAAGRRTNHVLTLHKTLHGGIPKFPLLGTFRDPYMGGLYYTTIKLGTPPRKFHVQIDTGSNDLWVNCKPCPSCPWKSKLGFRPNHFLPWNSSTARPVGCYESTCSSMGGQCTNETSLCEFSKEYEGGRRGALGYYITDLMQFDDVIMPGLDSISNTSARILFGCSTFLTGGFTQENQSIDGILGLGKTYQSPVLQLTGQLMTPPIFSHCFGGDGNGTLVLGEFDYHTSSPIVYTSLLPSTMRYNLDLKSITVKGKVLAINPNVFNTSSTSGTFVDSGISLSYLVAEAYDAFLDAINTELAKYAAPIHYQGTICYKMFISQIDRFPSVAFHFGDNATIVLNPIDYLLKHRPIINGAPSLCIGFQKTTIDNFTIFGDLVLKEKIIIYDIDRKRLGWSGYYNCSEEIARVSESSCVAQRITLIRHFMIYILYFILI